MAFKITFFAKICKSCQNPLKKAFLFCLLSIFVGLYKAH